MNKNITKELLIDKLAESLDITPSQYQEALKRYNNLKSYIESHISNIDLYLQGSFKLGTTIRPIKHMEEKDFDIDIVCELQNDIYDLKKIKNSVGDVLKTSNYNKFLDEEGKRCWTLNYKENNNSEGFHIDLLPCVHETNEKILALKTKSVQPELLNTAIKITNKISENNYIPKTSNPKGLYAWFNDISNKTFIGSKEIEKAKLFEKNRDYFINNLNVNSINEIDDTYVRTPLQKVVQILKRHRDIMFSAPQYNEDFKPISVIITVIVANIAKSNIDKFSSTYDLLNITLNTISEYSELTADGVDSDFLQYGKDKKLIIKKPNLEGWYIENPANPGENLADRWQENSNARAKAFFTWASKVKSDLSNLINENDLDKIMPMINYNFGKITADTCYRLCDKWIAENSNSSMITPTKPWSNYV